jgi:hypothetical protein
MDTLHTCRQTFRHAGRWIHFTHAGRHSGMQAEGYNFHIQADIPACRQMVTLYTCRQTFRHAGRWLHMYADMQACRQMVTHAGRYSSRDTYGYTWRQMTIQYTWRQMAPMGGKRLHMKADGYACRWLQMETDGCTWRVMAKTLTIKANFKKKKNRTI